MRTLSGSSATALRVARKELTSAARDQQTVIYTVVLPLVLYPLIFWVMIQARAFLLGSDEATTVHVALYAGDWYGMEPQYRTFFRWISLILAIPLVGSAARPFFTAAWRDLRRFTPGMDLPVALGIAIAFAASGYATLIDRGAVYFDSVAMFVFLLLGARYLELAVRNRAVESVERLAATSPDGAIRLNQQTAREEHVPALALRTGDRVVVRAGDVVPADGVVTEGSSSVDESLLSGESTPVAAEAIIACVEGMYKPKEPKPTVKKKKKLNADLKEDVAV